MNQKKVSMQSIADQLGVSKVTVYKALTGKPYVSDELQTRIIQTADLLGYKKPVPKNRELKNRLAFIVPKRFFLEDESFYTTIFYYLNNASQRDEITLTLYVIGRSDENALVLPSGLKAEDFDGMFIAGEMIDDYVHKLSSLKLPMLLIDFYKLDFDFDCVITDNFFNGYTATNYLIARGHKSIGFLGNPNQTSSISDRFFGYRKALAKYNLVYEPSWHLVNNDPETGIYSLNTALPDRLPTAYVCHCDRAAYFLMQRLDMAGIKVPEDISIISFDNTKLAMNSTPPLTTINIDTKEIARRSYKQLCDRIANPNMQKQKLYIACDIIERDSVAPPR